MYSFYKFKNVCIDIFDIDGIKNGAAEHGVPTTFVSFSCSQPPLSLHINWLQKSFHLSCFFLFQS